MRIRRVMTVYPATDRCNIYYFNDIVNTNLKKTKPKREIYGCFYGFMRQNGEKVNFPTYKYIILYVFVNTNKKMKEGCYE